jgi:peroxiredoxin (alkyl hydroperoxide reductase subunit C)
VVKIGERVTDFEVEAFHNEEIKKIRLSDYAGKWVVLLFYPADFTFVCPTELAEAADYYPAFQQLGAEVMSVSTDTAFVHKAWHDQSPAIRKIQYPMLADPAGNLCREFGTYIESQGLSWRGTFIIDPDRILRSADIHDNSIGRSSEEILRRLQAAVFVREHQGEVCPASWRPGQQTLKPALDLIGKI